MKNIIRAQIGIQILSLMSGFFVSIECDGAEPREKTVLRIMAFNIRHGRGMDEKVDLQRTAEVIKHWKPDLVAVQEVDRNTNRTEKTDQTKRLGEMTGLYAVFGKAIDYQDGEYGLTVLSRFPILKQKMILLPPGVQQEQRGILVVSVKVPDENGQEIRFASTHLSVASEEERLAQVKRINELFFTEDNDFPTIIAGDFNAIPSTKPMAVIKEKWIDSAIVATEKVDKPDRTNRIDFILFRSKDGFDVRESRTIEDRITSDHFPILSVLAL